MNRCATCDAILASKVKQAKRPNDSEWLMPNPSCRCNSTFGIVLMPGEHYHPCPVHREFFVVGSNFVSCASTLKL